MDGEGLLETLKEYQEKLNQVEQALSVTPPGEDRDNLQELKDNITLLINLSQHGIEPDQSASTSTSNDSNLQDEYSLFMAEMVKEGAIETTKANDIEEELKDLEGMKCRAPHEHSWGDIVYHNALICTVIESEDNDYENIIVKVMYTNPTHKEMLPCPYFLESDCKFSDDKCRFSHGELVHFSKLQEYIEPDYENLIVGSFVLAKQSDNLWYRATIKRIFPEKCLVKFDSNNKEVEIELTNIFPTNECNDNYESEDEKVDVEDVINMSLMNPVTEKIGDWEKYTKGVGSKLMEKMGYVIGTGLGKRADGIINPVSAVVLPPGKSLDHCMELRENAGGDQNLFSVERKLKRLQRKQEKKNQKIYEKETKKVDVFKFLNNTIYNNKPKDTVTISKSEHRKEIKKESCRNLNVESLKIDEGIREVEKDLFKISESLQRHKDPKSQVHKQLKKKLCDKQIELESLKSKALNIKNEQTVRSDKKKLTVF